MSALGESPVGVSWRRMKRLHGVRRSGFGPLVVAALAACFWASGAQAARLTLIECQHPMVTGEEAYALKNVTAATACPVVLILGRWEGVSGNIARLFKCVGPGKHTPVLELKTFAGWQLAITSSGFRMSRGTSSFEVTGTDFPLNCS
jgi:hypothetical protein